jgi:endoplasmic reticulum lectin 1
MERLLIIFVFIALAYGQFSPFDDSILFEISWPTKHPLNHETSLTEELEFESLTTPDNEQYKCYISHQPQAQSTDEGVIGNSLTPDVLLKEVIESKECVYLVEGYWTYELCYGVSLRQFHEDKNKEGKVIKSLEFLLGKFDSKGSLPPSTVDVPPTWFYVNKNYPYYEITLENGSPCDIRESTNRLTHLLFICDSEQSPVASLVMIKETTTCEYQAVVATSQLCQNSLYQIKKKPVHPIQCHAVDGGPRSVWVSVASNGGYLTMFA